MQTYKGMKANDRIMLVLLAVVLLAMASCRGVKVATADSMPAASIIRL